MNFVIGTAGETAAIQAADAAVEGLPRKGVAVGAGPHAEIPETPGPGWSTNVAEPTQHPVQKTSFAYPVPPELPAKLTAYLPPALVTRMLSAAPLAPDWFPVPDPEPLLIGRDRVPT